MTTFARSVSVALCVVAWLAPAAGRSQPAHAKTNVSLQRVVLAGGCFWGMEAVFERLKGVTSTVAGFSGGAKATAHYEMVSTGMTGHAESVEVLYDPATISFRRLLDVYFTVAHDPTQLNRQGPDYGTQYRSEIFYTSEQQRREAQAYVKRLTETHAFADPIVTKLEPLRGFYPAEAYHQHFVDKNPDNPYVVENDLPKLSKLHQRFGDLLKTAT